MLKSVAAFGAIFFYSACLFGQEPEKASPPKELIQYVREAQKAGQNVVQIEQNAVNAGWPTGTVDDAIAYLKSLDKAQADADAKTAAAPKVAAVAPGSGEALPPAGENKPPADSAATPPKEPASETPPPATDASGGTPAAHTNPLDYPIGAGDVLKVTVWHEADASLPSTVVLPNGRINIPLLHEIEVAGLTVPQLEQLLTEKFSAFINLPSVSVGVIQMNSKKIYMTGKVKREGPIPFSYQMTVMQALSEAGGVTDFAKKKGIYVLRTENGKQFKLDFDYASVLKGKHLETNYVLIPGDMIVVP